MNYIVSVVVPTRNRYQYLKHLIQMIDGFKLAELELVVQDNSDDNREILNFLKNINADNIKYFYISQPLTMSQNGELAINNATGEYVCYIGDDDGVCRNIVDCAMWMKKNDINAVYNSNLSFLWGSGVKYRRPFNGYTIHSSEEELHKLMTNGMNLLLTNMPLIYHGIVKKTILNSIQEKYGTLFPSVPPDISGSICLATVIEKYCELYTPVIINGASSMTGGGVIARGGVLPLNEVGFITQKEIDEWSPLIPPIWCGNYGWAESGIKTIKHVGREDLLKSLNLNCCLAHAVSLRPHLSVLWTMGWNYAASKFFFIMYVIYLFVKRYIVKINNNLPFNVKKGSSVKTISEAESFFMKYATAFK